MIELHFTIPGKVQAKQSAKFRQIKSHSGKEVIQSYQPSSVTNYANWVKQCFINEYPSHNPMIFEGKQLAIKTIAYFQIPKSKSKKFKEQALKGERRPITKPDTDNIAKNIKDALNKIAFPDDSQIVLEIIEKRYGEIPRAEVYIKEINDKEQ